ncbi:MAG: glycosyl hydrolase [Myxococcales bacterium]|nr:glycosyl hydrolase [Myxococcales bacterium]
MHSPLSIDQNAPMRWLIFAFLIGCQPLIYPDQCQEGEAPDSSCFAQKRPLDSAEVELASRLANRWMQTHAPGDLPWNWEEGVALFALTELHRVTGDEALLDYIEAYLEHHHNEGYKVETSDQCPAAASAVSLLAHRPSPTAQTVIDRVEDYLANDARRTEDGGINHMGVLAIMDPTLWVDSLFMFGEVWLRRADLEQNDAALARFDAQFGIFSDRLQEDDGLYTHAADWIIEQTPGVFWARGNAWVTAAGYDALRIHRLRGVGAPIHAAALERQARRILELQDAESGLWWTLMTEPGEAYEEVSGSALFLFGLARAWRYGFLGDEILPALHRGKRGILAAIDERDDGPAITGISGPTTAATREDYLRVPLEEDLPYGVGAMILALIELAGLPEPL